MVTMTAEQTLISSHNDEYTSDAPSTPQHRYSSPPPPGTGRWDKNPCYSPPPPPRGCARSVRDVDPDVDSMLLELNSGRSMLNTTKPVPFPDLNLPHRALFAEFAREDKNERGGPFCIDSDGGLKLALPSYPRLLPRLTFSRDSIGEIEEDDMLSTPSLVRLRVRTSPIVSPVARRMKKGGQLDYNVVTVKSEHGDDDDGRLPNGGNSLFETRSSSSAFSTR